MKTAIQELEKLSEDPAVHRLARERQEALKLYNVELATSRAHGEKEGIKKGEKEGMKKGKAEVLLKLLQLKFDTLSDADQARVNAATVDKLEQWIERVLTAKTLVEVFAD